MISAGIINAVAKLRAKGLKPDAISKKLSLNVPAVRDAIVEIENDLKEGDGGSLYLPNSDSEEYEGGEEDILTDLQEAYQPKKKRGRPPKSPEQRQRDKNLLKIYPKTPLQHPPQEVGINMDQYMSLADACEKTGIKYHTIITRIRSKPSLKEFVKKVGKYIYLNKGIFIHPEWLTQSKPGPRVKGMNRAIISTGFTKENPIKEAYGNHISSGIDLVNLAIEALESDLAVMKRALEIIKTRNGVMSGL